MWLQVHPGRPDWEEAIRIYGDCDLPIFQAISILTVQASETFINPRHL